MKNCDNYKGLLVGLLDHELTPEETSEVNTHLIRCETCRRDYEKLRETSGRLAAASFIEPGDVVLDQVWNRPYTRFTRNAALFLVIGGYLLLVAYALLEFFRSGDDGMALARVAVASIVLGILFLLIQLIRERCKLWKTDPYKDITR
jgi:anti-sigma factor RsiW